MDFKKLAAVGQGQQEQKPSPKQAILDSIKKRRAAKQAVLDSIKKRRAAKQAILDSIKKRRAAKQADSKKPGRTIKDSKQFRKFKITDAYKALRKRIKDDLAETETTEEAVNAALGELTPDTPAEQVVAAVVEVLAETIDELQEQVESPEEALPEDDSSEEVLPEDDSSEEVLPEDE